MKIALLADLHLPDSERTVKEEVLDWLFRPRSGWAPTASSAPET